MVTGITDNITGYLENLFRGFLDGVDTLDIRCRDKDMNDINTGVNTPVYIRTNGPGQSTDRGTYSLRCDGPYCIKLIL